MHHLNVSRDTSVTEISLLLTAGSRKMLSGLAVIRMRWRLFAFAFRSPPPSYSAHSSCCAARSVPCMKPSLTPALRITAPPSSTLLRCSRWATRALWCASPEAVFLLACDGLECPAAAGAGGLSPLCLLAPVVCTNVSVRYRRNHSFDASGRALWETYTS